jgi:hypothetical protein
VSKDTAAVNDSLPDDDALDALLPPPKKRRPAPATRPPQPQDRPRPEQPAAGVTNPAAPAPAPAARPAPAAVPEPKAASAPAPLPAQPAKATDTPAVPAPLDIQRPQVGDQRSTQCTVNVHAGVRARFAAYQLAKKVEAGAEPTNAVVVRRAVLHARKFNLFAQMLETVRHEQTPAEAEDDDPDGLFGDVVGRRAERGRVRQVAQLPFRPSYRELAVIDAMAAAYGFANRSEFLNAALDEFLPLLQDKRRRS